MGVLFKVHNNLGRFAREKQYGDAIEELLKKEKIIYVRERPIPVLGIKSGFTNIVDFDINNQLLLEIKAKPIITKLDYFQIKRYLDASSYKLGLLVNFRRKYLNPIRVIRANS